MRELNEGELSMVGGALVDERGMSAVRVWDETPICELPVMPVPDPYSEV